MESGTRVSHEFESSRPPVAVLTWSSFRTSSSPHTLKIAVCVTCLSSCTSYAQLVRPLDVASTSPPSSGFTTNTPTSAPLPASEFNDNYEVEVVEIRVQGNELDGIIP